MAGPPGFEPGLKVLETCVLPLHYGPKVSSKIAEIGFSDKLKDPALERGLLVFTYPHPQPSSPPTFPQLHPPPHEQLPPEHPHPPIK